MNEQKTQKKILEDEAIIDLYWSRNERAIEATDDKYRKYLFTISYNILHDRLDCEECLNDTYLGTWNRIPPTRPTAFQIFLSRIMRNISLARYRKNSASKRVPSELTVTLDELDECMVYTESVAEEYLISEISRILSEYLRELPERQEFTFFCRYYCSDCIADIARMLRVSDSTVFRDLTAMRNELKKRLRKVGYYHGEEE